ncbi:glycosyltransferase family 4 protein [Yimella sp. cx-573]|nr:glycosyltransferase family 4 protein [Yimella sp. cx-573]
MRVGLVSPYSFDVPGGVQLHVRDLAEYLIGHGHYVEVLAPAEPDTVLPPYIVSAGSALPVPYNGSVARLTFGPVTSARVARWIEGGRFDVLHVHEPISPSVSMLAMWAADGPLVATFHTSNTKSRALLAAGPMLQPGLEKVMGRIAVSSEARRFVRQHIGGDAVVIPNGVYVDKFAAAPIDARWQGTQERPTIAFLGRIEEPRKGLHVLLDAMPQVLAAHPGLRLLVAGPGDPKEVLQGRPEQVVRACEFLGPISDAEKQSFLRSVDIYVAPNTGGESFGIILVEAMSAGVAVVASDIPAFRAVLDDGWAGALFANEHADELADVVLELLAVPADRALRAEQGSRRARRFDWSRVAADVVSVYETVCAGAPATSAASEVRPLRWWRSRA